MKRGIVFALALAIVGLVACGKNEAATEACKDSNSSEKCETCCKSHGASGYTYASTCGCLGGN